MTSENTDAPSTSSPSKKDRDATVEAVNHLIQGKRHLLVQDIPSAVSSLQEACGLLAACYGELANECGDAYLHYGIALLEQSRLESGLLGNENQEDGSAEDEDDDDDDGESDGKDEEEDEDEGDSADGKTTADVSKLGNAVGEKEEGGNNIGGRMEEESGIKNPDLRQNTGKGTEDSEAKSEDLEDSKKDDEGTTDVDKSSSTDVQNCEKATPSSDGCPQPESSSSSNKATSSVEPDSSSKAAAAEASGPSSSSAQMPSTSSGEPGTSSSENAGEKSKNEDEDISTLQLAWEVLEVAKVIYKRQSEGNREFQLKLAQIQAKLGEVAMESENYQQAVSDLQECLNIQLTLLPSDDRGIAETYYQLGLAYSFDNQCDLAIGHFKDAIKTLEDRIDNLKKGAPIANTTEGDAFLSSEREIKELEELIPEIRDKITDTEDMMKNAIKLPEELDKGLVPEQCQEERVDSTVNATANPSPSKVPKPVTNIGHLVRKKRKPEDEAGNSNHSDESETKRSKVSESNAPDSGSTSGEASSYVNGTNKSEK